MLNILIIFVQKRNNVMNILQKLPLGIQDFEKIRKENYLYIDKTQSILDFIHEGSYIFFARPRRFGKSLLCSTLRCVYQGKKELFEGLYIYDKIDWEAIQRPVIHVDLSKVAFQDISLSEGLDNHLDELGAEQNFTFKTQGAQSKLNEMIAGLARQSGKNVVVLIDEYDKALTDVLGDDAKFEEHRDILRGFYGIFKPNDKYLHQVMLTGVSKYGKLSVFSQLNNVTDYSLFKKYSTLCGYTPEELEFYFQDYLAATALELEVSEAELLKIIRYKYNGYSFDGETRLYTPFSILSFFTLREFRNFWYDTGTPSYLLKQLQKQQIKIHQLEGFKSNITMLNVADIEYQSPTSLLFQTGYLTIRAITGKKINPKYILDFPNAEVKQAFSQYLLMTYTNRGADLVSSYISMPLQDALEEVDLDEFCRILKGVYADIPYQIFEKTEAYYHTIFHVTLNSIGLKTQSEVQSNLGRIDSVVETDENIFIFEFKLDEDQAEALAQIENNQYYQKYQNQPLPIYAIGISFSSQDKNIETWVVKQLKK
jgi:hypothetical protein